jgi:hypothetical protein
MDIALLEPCSEIELAGHAGGGAPLFIGLTAASRRARARRGSLDAMLALHARVLDELEALATTDEQALLLCGRLLGLVLDAENGGDLHALVRLRRGLRLAAGFLELRGLGPVQLVARIRSLDPDLRLQLDGHWLDIDLRPRRLASGERRYRMRPGGRAPRLERSPLS